MSKAVSITMNFGVGSVKKGGGEVSSVFQGITKDARRTGQEVTKALNVRTDTLVKNLGAVARALRQVQDIAKSGRLADIIKAADAAARAEVQAAQRAAREKEKLAGEAVKRAQKVADAEAREAARMERVKVMAAEKAADREAKAAQAAEREKTRIRTAEMQAANRLEVEKLKAVEAAERQKVAISTQAERDRQRAAENGSKGVTGEKVAKGAQAGLSAAGGALVATGTALTAALTVPLAAFAAYAVEVGTKYDAALARTEARRKGRRRAARLKSKGGLMPVAGVEAGTRAAVAASVIAEGARLRPSPRQRRPRL